MLVLGGDHQEILVGEIDPPSLSVSDNHGTERGSAGSIFATRFAPTALNNSL